MTATQVPTLSLTMEAMRMVDTPIGGAADVVDCRSYIPAYVALAVKAGLTARFVLDARSTMNPSDR